MLYLLNDLYYNGDAGEFERTPVCGFTSGSKAKEIENLLYSYYETYKDGIVSPVGYFDVLKANTSEITRKVSEILDCNYAKASSFVNSLRFERFNHSKVDICSFGDTTSSLWKGELPWFKAKEITEY